MYDETDENRLNWVHHPGCHGEIGALFRNALDPALSYEEHVEYWGQLRDLMRSAMTGRVVARRGGDATVIRDLILELRPILETQRAPFGRKIRQLRLYYGEPEVLANALLALRLATKAASDEGFDEQDEDIEIAIQRAHDWQAGR
ncbi:hypothetical protein [Microbacterium sp. Leaf179]|uniref:hypothetical protein n=1 Tax=Microbacterium sp. Leaf179 TaxID=1736288 RepID=UPI0007002612|nr:hypothetical protein [Microbacterium sp. Leaf179]KQR88748.1 hypothetical protein ASF96_02975 [Microbacterium sp. Leaf179]